MYTPLDVFSAETWILLIIILILIRLYIHKRWSVLKNLNIPHDPPSILGIGNLGKLLKDFDKFLNIDFELKKKYGKVYGMYFWLSPRVVIWDTEILKHIFIKEFSNFPDRQKNFTRVNGKEMNTALTTVSGSQWKRIRHSVSPLFSASKLKGMMNIVADCSDKMVCVLQKICDEKEGRFDVKEVYGNYSMDVVCAAAFRINVNSQDPSAGDAKGVEMARKLFNQNTFMKNPWFWIITIFPWAEDIAAKMNVSLFNMEVVGYFRRLVEFVIKKNESSTNKTKQVDILQTMLDSEVSDDQVHKSLARGLTRDEIVGNSIVLILASYENVATTLLCLSYCVAVYDGVQEKLYEELTQTIDKEGSLTYDGVSEMRYLDMCLKETLRLYSISPRNNRFAEKDITINGFFIPAGMTIDVPVSGLSHDEEYWDSPWEFKPERFEDMSKIDPMMYLPFGAGPRNCIGMRFALFEVKVAMCKLLEKYQFSPCEDTPKPPMELTIKGSIRPKKDLFLRVTPRQSTAA